MQHDMEYSSQGCDNFVLITSTKKTEVMYQAAPVKPYLEKHITVKGQNLQAVDNFTYLGSTLSRVVYIDAKVNKRIAKTSVAFGSRLCDNVWKLRGNSLSTKLTVYLAAVLTILLCETWTVYSRQAEELNHFHLSCLRRLPYIIW